MYIKTSSEGLWVKEQPRSVPLRDFVMTDLGEERSDDRPRDFIFPLQRHHHIHRGTTATTNKQGVSHAVTLKHPPSFIFPVALIVLAS